MATQYLNLEFFAGFKSMVGMRILDSMTPIGQNDHITGIPFRMIGVNVKDNESIERAINRFKKLMTRSRILNEYKERQQFVKPSEERREAMKKSVREQRRRSRDNY